MKKVSKWSLMMVMSITLVACGSFYHLPGHKRSNWDNPPDVTLRVGDVVDVLTVVKAPISMGTQVPASMRIRIDDNTVVRGFQPEGSKTFKIEALRPGTTKVTYSIGNGFKITVVP